MTNKKSIASKSTPIWFWAASGIALLWNLMGLLAFTAQMMMTEESLASLPQAQQDVYNSIPTLVYVFFGIAVIAGVAGSTLLLIRNKLAIPALVVSLVGVLVQYGHMFFMTETVSVMGAAAMILPVLVVIVSIALVPFATTCNKKGILR